MDGGIKTKENDNTNKEDNGNHIKRLEIYWNSFFGICIALSIILIVFSCFEVNNFNNNIKKYNLNYSWPNLSEILIPSILILPLIIISKLPIEFFSKGIVEHCLARKYKYPKNDKYKQLGNIYRHKLARHIYKFTFYTAITLYGYQVLKNLPYFPKSMLGNGHMEHIFLKGFPESYFHERSPLFILYYNISLAYFVNDLIFLFISERQSDFIIMFLHHICSISLIIFSYITNYSNIGSLVIFCHMQSDILMHLTRFLIQTDTNLIIIGFIGLSFTSNFIYMRQFVFGKMIWVIMKYITWKWGIITTTLWLFLVILYIMHLRWSYILLYKLRELITTKKNMGDEINYDKILKNGKRDEISKKIK